MRETLFRDFLFLTLLGFVMMLLIVLPWLNPPTKEKLGDITPPGNVMVQITWPPGISDVDLWVYGPREIRPVGYSNKGGALWNLLRDDLGNPDPTLNFEDAFTRGIFAGEYIINLHCYRCVNLPIEVKVTVYVKKDLYSGKSSSMGQIAVTTVKLKNQGEELTAMRFRLTEEGDLVEGSLNHVFQKLRSGDNYGLGN